MYQVIIPCADREEAIYLKLELLRRLPDLRQTGIEVCEDQRATLIVHTLQRQVVQRHVQVLRCSEVA